MVVPISSDPVSGKRRMGKRAVTAMGTISVTHHKAIQIVTHKTSNAGSGMVSGLPINCRRIKLAGPNRRITDLKFNFILGIECAPRYSFVGS